MPSLPSLLRRPVEDREDLRWALRQFEGRQQRNYGVFGMYDDGDHPLTFATEKFRSVFFDVFKEYTENMCPAVVDALNDRLEITGFSSNRAVLTEETVSTQIPGMPTRKRMKTEDPVAHQAWDIWTRSRLDLRSAEVHREALLMGDSYVIVWPNDQMEAEIWPQYANECRVQYDPNNRGKLLRGVKIWFDYVEKKHRVNVYLPDRIDKYITRNSDTSLPPAEQAQNLEKIDMVPNPYRRVPLFHFPNARANRFGVSELKDVIPIQDGLNKSVVDMLVAMEFAAYKQRYVIGMEVEIDEMTGEPTDPRARNYGVDRLMAVPDPEAKVGQFDATDLTQFLKVQDKFWLSCARVTGTPLHYFYLTSGDFPSGEAIKSAEGRFIKRIGDRQTNFGNQWEDALRFAMLIDGILPNDDATNPLTLSANWEDATPRSESELADTAVKKKAVGIPPSQLMREMGYSEEEIDRFIEEFFTEMIAKAQLAAKPQEEQGTGPSRDTTRARQGQEGGGQG